MNRFNALLRVLACAITLVACGAGPEETTQSENDNGKFGIELAAQQCCKVNMHCYPEDVPVMYRDITMNFTDSCADNDVRAGQVDCGDSWGGYFGFPSNERVCCRI